MHWQTTVILLQAVALAHNCCMCAKLLQQHLLHLPVHLMICLLCTCEGTSEALWCHEHLVAYQMSQDQLAAGQGIGGM